MSRCRTCNAEIIWAKTPAGKLMPLDAQSELRFVIEGDKLTSDIVACRPLQVRTSHFATCPQADEHRRPR